MSGDESELLRAATRGNADALDELLRMHGPDVHRRLVISPIWQAALDAADVMQVTYLEAFLRIHQLDARTGDKFRAWLDRLAHNNLRDAIRELERQKRPDRRLQLGHGTAGDSTTTLLEELGTGTSTASRVVARQESQQALEAALAQLPPLYAQVVRRHDLDGQPVPEVAAALGRSCGAVYMLRARALDRLRELLGPESQFLSRGT